MRLEEPGWWYDRSRGAALMARVLSPLGWAYGALAERRVQQAKPYRCRLPVICVGNLTTGGTGKTPLSLEIASLLIRQGEKPVFLTRGYKGRLAGPVWADLKTHTAYDIGDEPLLLARSAPTMVARDRRAGAMAIESASTDASVIIMDDGLQNPALVKDLTFAVVDGRRGIGNGEIFPAGPLRAPLAFQLSLADAIVVNSPETAPTADSPDILTRLRRSFPGPVLSVRVGATDSEWLRGNSVVAYAGIGNPERFFGLLARLGAHVAARRSFPDHHVYSDEDAEQLLEQAHKTGALLVTTEKDLARLTGMRGPREALRSASRALAIRLEMIEEGDRLASLVAAAIKRPQS